MSSDFNNFDFDIDSVINTGAADAIAEDWFQRGGQPAIAYGIVNDGRLVH